ncbi:MAG: hypothetical protein WHW07_03830 [Bacteroidales bacterium]|nr:hypothetical protein [Bacteroidales bacterium]HOM35752.1 hypothetical protein [Bacteroidales bacterium]HUM31896.1 hypothetical protein [Bacteroidales bacterium]
MISENQFLLPSPNTSTSSYLLAFNSEKFFNTSLNNQLSGEFKDYFKAKFDLISKVSESERNNLLAAAGIFTNRLAEIFENLETISSKDFSPVYYLWLNHCKGNVNPGDKIIKAFEGLCVYIRKGINSEHQTSLEINSGFNINAFPFVNIQTNQSNEWIFNYKLNISQNTYDIYMFDIPELTELPSSSKILNCWKRLSSNCHIDFVSSNMLVSGKKLQLRVKFGPIADFESIKNIILDEKYTLSKIPDNKKFVKSIKITSDPGKISIDDDNFCYLIVEVLRDENFISLNYSTLSTIISNNLYLRLYYDISCGKDTLDIKYAPVEIITERFPSPRADYEIKPVKLDKFFEYSSIINFYSNNTQFSVGTAPFPPRITELKVISGSVDQKFHQCLKEASFKIKNINQFELSFKIPAINNYFSAEQRSIELIAVIEFYSTSGNLYKRQLPLKLIAPDEMLNKRLPNLQVIIKDPNELLKLLDNNAVLPDGKTIQKAKEGFDFKNDEDNIKFIKYLKRNNVITESVFGHFKVYVKFLNF